MTDDQGCLRKYVLLRPPALHVHVRWQYSECCGVTGLAQGEEYADRKFA